MEDYQKNTELKWVEQNYNANPLAVKLFLASKENKSECNEWKWNKITLTVMINWWTDD